MTSSFGHVLAWLGVLAGAAVVYVVSVIIYRLFFHPLAKYPGPLLAKLTDAYQLYHAYKGDRHLEFHRMHEKYGRVVRFGPNSLSFNTNSALKDIYGFRSNVRKAEFYNAFVHPTANTHNTRDKEVHARKRRVLAHAFSDSAMKEMQRYILGNIRTFCEQIGLQDGGGDAKGWTRARNMSHWCNYLAMDILGDLSFGKAFHMLESPDNRFALELVEAATTRHLICGTMPVVDRLNIDKLLFPKLAAGRARYMAYSKGQLSERTKLGEETDRRDFFYYLLKARDPETGQGFTTPELWSESNLLIIAGSDTTSTAMAATLFYLVRNQHALQRATEEVRAKFKDVEQIVHSAELGSCHYLRACIDEAMRLSPSVGGILPREVLPGGITVDGHTLPAGTVIGTPHYAIHHNEAYFPSAYSYVPERWLSGAVNPLTGRATSEADLATAHSAFCPFSVGPRGCIGKGMAYAEMMTTIARTVFLYDLRKAVGVEDPGEGRPGRGWGRHRASEFQLIDTFTSAKNDNCRFEHPSNSGPRPQTSNRFASGGNAQNGLEKYSISLETLEKDLTIEKPQWILSAYAPGRGCPDQLFGGYPREQSFEEMRLHYMMGKTAGNEQQALNEAQQLYHNAEEQIQNALRNLPQAAQFVLDAENRHPNRIDICNQGTQGAPFGEFAVGKRSLPAASGSSQANTFGTPASNPFGAPASAPGSAFGQPSALGQRASPFGAPSFGQPSQPVSSLNPQQQSPFGQPSQGNSSFGSGPQPTPAFGQPSTLGAKPNPFGTPAFGQPSQLGSQAPTGAPAFGQPSQPGSQGTAFGQPSQLGQKPNPFASTTNSTTSPFGAAATNAAPNSALANPFGSPAGATSSPFGAAGNNTASPSPFGAASTTNASPFGAVTNSNTNAAAPASNPFGSANPPQSNAQSPFGNKSNQTQASPSPFGQPAQSASPFAQAATSSASPFAANQNSAASTNPFGQPQQQAGGLSALQGQQQPRGGFPATNGAGPFQQAAANPFGTQPAQPAQPQQASANTGHSGPYPPGSTKQHPPIESYSSRGMDGRLTMFKGQPVVYKGNKPGVRGFDGSWHGIWFPNGPPAYSRDTELPAEEYDEKSKAQWAAFAQTGKFTDGLLPELPPPRELTTWDF
ncbi:hypothetical protein S40288_01915 [Stachybotrys chartarum IBT 40288]|nr:hypothetical protein S40288_01915 [Stachybotrys chartarum IBT 40288]